MFPTQVILTATRGSLPEQEFVFDEPALCVIGRAPDCDICVPRDPAHADVSRHHCLLDIDPPSIRVCDLGSLNGTYVNGDKIGQRRRDIPPDKTDLLRCTVQNLKNGDEIRVGSVVFQVGVGAS